MPVWPVSLPQKQFIGLSEQREDARVRTEMDAGPAKMRRRFTAASRLFSIPIALDGQQRQDFDTFYITTLQEGVLSFDWEDPVNDATVTFRFREPPELRLIVGGTTTTRRWRGVIALEILP